jgi:hypothetical protein
MIFSTTLCGNYDNWKNNPNISEIINVKTNPMCVNLKNTYPDVEDKVIQSITLGFLCNMCYTISQYKNINTYENNDLHELENSPYLEVD